MILIKGISIKFILLMGILLFVNNLLGQNNPPTALYDVATVDQDTTLNVPSGAPDNYLGLLDNDIDLDGDALTITRFSINGVSYNVGQTATIVGIGTIVINGNGTYVFIPVTGYSGPVPDISYTLYDGIDTSLGTLFLTVETTANTLLEITRVGSCNQGYTTDGYYKIRYQVEVANTSITRGYHENSNITNVQVFNDLNSIFGAGCITEIQRDVIQSTSITDFVGGTYPSQWDNADWDVDEFPDLGSSDDPTPGAQGIFDTNTNTQILYPRQRIRLDYCLLIDPACAGSSVDFDNILSATSSRGSSVLNLLLIDFHTSETTVAANLFVPNPNPIVNFDGTYDFINTVIITNDGAATATDVNFNMGLQSFIDNSIVFSAFDHDNDIATPNKQTPFVQQVNAAGNVITTTTVNTTYNGISDPKLLEIGQSLNAGESIFLQIVYHVDPIPTTSNNIFVYPFAYESMSQGLGDGYDEETENNTFSYVIWSDAQGNHLDTFYLASSETEPASSNNQCLCVAQSMEFSFGLNLEIEKTIGNVVPNYNGILEHKQVTFNFHVENLNTSNVRIIDVALVDNLLGICNGNILSVDTPVITLPTVTSEIPEETPNINASYNGITNTAVFDGASGILNPGEFLDVAITVVIVDDCIGQNIASLSGDDPLNANFDVSSIIAVAIFTDTDGDNITNLNDLDDDNDGIPDTDEYNGLDPLIDADGDNIPNYRDTDFGADANGDGIVDSFDFDNDGVPNHLDLDSDGDGIADIIEANMINDTFNGTTNNAVGANGLDDTIENVDDLSAIINTALIENTDSNGNPNYLDIDADDDGIVDNIEAQPTDTYVLPSNTVNPRGFDTAYPNGLLPIDTEGDNIADFIDVNSDNDIRNDRIEGWDFLNNDGIPETVFSNLDSDNDGLDNAYDVDDTQVNPTNGQVPLDFPNQDDMDTTERDWRELMAIVITITNEETTEGGDLVFNLKLTSKGNVNVLVSSPTDIIIDLSTSDGTTTTTQYEVAVSPFDYTGIASTLPTEIIIIAGQTDYNFPITSNDDIIYELTEFFELNGTITSGNTFNTSFVGEGKILDNDNPPTIVLFDDVQDEGLPLSHKIEISHPCSTPISIDVITADDTAINPEDYISFLDTVIIDGTNPTPSDPTMSNTEVSILVATIIDSLNEPLEEYLFVNGEITTGNTMETAIDAIGTIIDIDPDPTVIISSPTAIEGEILHFTVSLINGIDPSVPVANYSDIIIQLHTSDGTAKEPNDYESLPEYASITFPALKIDPLVVKVNTIDDTLSENSENLTLHGVVTTFNTENIDPSNIGTILDNDIPNLFSPNNDGISDMFEIRSINAYPNFILKIFDRWGSIVYDYNNNGKPQPTWWDGTRNGANVPEGVYYYTLDYNDGVVTPKSGFVELVR